MATSRSDWSVLACIWPLLEPYGLNEDDIATWNPRPPCLVIGSGQGLLVNAILDRGSACFGIDWSHQMNALASDRRAAPAVTAHAAFLPIASHTFESVIIATGVLDGDNEPLGAIMAEAARVLSTSGTLMVGVSALPEAEQRLGQSLGLLVNGHFLRKRLLDLWNLKRQGQPLAPTITAWCNIGLDEAAQRLHQVDKHLNTWFGFFELLSETAIDPEPTMQAWSRPYKIFDEAGLRELLSACGFKVRSLQRGHRATLTATAEMVLA